jgi:hypothetical protein
MGQVVEHLPSKCEALNANPSTGKKKKKTHQMLVTKTSLASLETFSSFLKYYI